MNEHPVVFRAGRFYSVLYLTEDVAEAAYLVRTKKTVGFCMEHDGLYYLLSSFPAA